VTIAVFVYKVKLILKLVILLNLMSSVSVRYNFSDSTEKKLTMSVAVLQEEMFSSKCIKHGM